MKGILCILLVLGSEVVRCQEGFVKGEPSLAYWEVGTGDDVVIILHGGPCASHTYLRPEFDALSEVARLIHYDQRGCGKSDIKIDEVPVFAAILSCNRNSNALSRLYAIQ